MVPVVADADTLFGATTRGLLIHLDEQGLIRLHWSPLRRGFGLHDAMPTHPSASANVRL